VRTMLVVCGGYSGLYTAWKSEKTLRRDEAELTEISRP
jgi:NADH:ubiquinone reductase (H+-translocating)